MDRMERLDGAEGEWYYECIGTRGESFPVFLVRHVGQGGDVNFFLIELDIETMRATRWELIAELSNTIH